MRGRQGRGACRSVGWGCCRRCNGASATRPPAASCGLRRRGAVHARPLQSCAVQVDPHEATMQARRRGGARKRAGQAPLGSRAHKACCLDARGTSGSLSGEFAARLQPQMHISWFAGRLQGGQVRVSSPGAAATCREPPKATWHRAPWHGLPKHPVQVCVYKRQEQVWGSDGKGHGYRGGRATGRGPLDAHRASSSASCRCCFAAALSLACWLTLTAVVSVKAQMRPSSLRCAAVSSTAPSVAGHRYSRAGCPM